MTIVTRIIESLSHDPWVNLAWEEYFFRQVADDEIILYLWQNHNTVVIGRNQNAWKECRHVELERENGQLARRLSGGGAVFHDLGNLNFTFIMHNQHYDLSRQLSVILRAVKQLGINSEFVGRNDLVVQGRKFSGHAYYFHKDRALHHGTIMINSDLGQLERYLQVSPDKIVSKGIDSVRSRVANLVEFSANVKLTDVVSSIKENFIEVYGGPAIELAVEHDDESIGQLVRKYSSWEWRYGNTQEFDISLGRRFPWGEVEIGVCIQKGTIHQVRVFSDAMEENIIRDIEMSLQGCPFIKDRMAERISGVGAQSDNQPITGDLTRWLQAKDI